MNLKCSLIKELNRFLWLYDCIWLFLFAWQTSELEAIRNKLLLPGGGVVQVQVGGCLGIKRWCSFAPEEQHRQAEAFWWGRCCCPTFFFCGFLFSSGQPAANHINVLWKSSSSSDMVWFWSGYSRASWDKSTCNCSCKGKKEPEPAGQVPSHSAPTDAGCQETQVQEDSQLISQQEKNRERLEEERRTFETFQCGQSGQGKATKSLQEALMFYDTFVEEVLNSDYSCSSYSQLEPKCSLNDLAEFLAESTHSSAFSGVGAPETALLALHKAVQDRLPNQKDAGLQSLQHVLILVVEYIAGLLAGLSWTLDGL